MIADILTKPVKGEFFRALTVKVLGGGALDVTFQDNGRNSKGAVSSVILYSFFCSLLILSSGLIKSLYLDS